MRQIETLPRDVYLTRNPLESLLSELVHCVSLRHLDLLRPWFFGLQSGKNSPNLIFVDKTKL